MPAAKPVLRASESAASASASAATLAEPRARTRRAIPQFFVEMHDDGSFRRLLRAGVEDGHAVVVEHYCPRTHTWIADGALFSAWWFDRSHWRAISMGRALSVLDLLENGEVDLPAFEVLSSGHFPVAVPADGSDGND